MHIHFVSLGCDKNLVDSEIMLGIIDREGYKITQHPHEANVIIINTCGFIADANSESVEKILEMASYKQSGQCKALVVTGCMAQRYKEEIFKELPEVDAIVGVGAFEQIGHVIKEAFGGRKMSVIADNNRPIDEAYNLKRMVSTPGYFAYLKISEGCDNKCTYCTIPSIRGGYRSRKMENIVLEAGALAESGIKEVILVAQDTSLYGKDIYGKPCLDKLLRKISEISGIEWIRILYCYPEHITQDIIDEMAANSKVCHYIDMPIQHSHDAILKKMGRKSTNKCLEETIEKLRKAMPDISIRTTLIVGFPGETDEIFEELYNFINKIKFDRLGVFQYSQEEGTPAAKMDNQVAEKVKEKRKSEIMFLQQKISIKKCAEKIGENLCVIVDGKLPEENIFCGRSYMDCYDIDGMVFFPCSYELMGGDFVNVKVTGSSEYDLIGEIINDNESSE